MQNFSRHLVTPLFVLLSCVLLPQPAQTADDSSLTREQIKDFLQPAQVIKQGRDASLAAPSQRRH